MATITDIRKTVSESTPILALVGATDAAVRQVQYVVSNASTIQSEVEARVGKLQEDVEKAVTGFDAKQLQAKFAERLDPKALQAAAQQVPALAFARALDVAGRAEAGYESLAERGKVVVERVRSQKATQDLIKQGKVTLSRTKAAVTTARKAVDETANAALGVVKAGRNETAAAANETVVAAEEAVVTERAVGSEAEKPRVATRRTTVTTRKSASTARAVAKGSTSTRRTAPTAAKTAKTAETAKTAKTAKTGEDAVGQFGEG
jgi:hypothetical protein